MKRYYDFYCCCCCCFTGHQRRRGRYKEVSHVDLERRSSLIQEVTSKEFATSPNEERVPAKPSFPGDAETQRNPWRPW